MKVGRPKKYESAEELEKVIDQYFQEVQDESLKTTITGLALHLGFESRQSIYDYLEQGEFSYILKRALLFIENGYEKALYGTTVTGPIFALKNMGWKDQSQQEIIGAMPVIWHEQKIYVANGNVTTGNGNGHSHMENEKISE